MPNPRECEFFASLRIPDTYICVDIETTGLDTKNDLICSVGHSLVVDRKLKSTEEYYLNWSLVDGIDMERVKTALDEVAKAMEERGSTFHHSLDRLKTEGVNPIDVLARYRELFGQITYPEGLVMVNGWRFDIRFWESHFERYLREELSFNSECLYDAGIAEKAAQMYASDNEKYRRAVELLPGETLARWNLRIAAYSAPGIKWALSTHCARKYDLFNKAGVDQTQAHRSGVDTHLLHYLVESHRELADEHRKQRAIDSSDGSYRVNGSGG